MNKKNRLEMAFGQVKLGGKSETSADCGFHPRVCRSPSHQSKSPTRGDLTGANISLSLSFPQNGVGPSFHFRSTTKTRCNNSKKNGQSVVRRPGSLWAPSHTAQQSVGDPFLGVPVFGGKPKPFWRGLKRETPICCTLGISGYT